MPDRRQLVLATVTEIRDAMVTYPCCDHCYSKMLCDCNTNSWSCVKCGYSCDRDKLSWRFKLCLTISNHASLLHVTVFGKTLEQFFGKTAAQFSRFYTWVCKTQVSSENLLLTALQDVFVGNLYYFGLKSNKYAASRKDSIHVDLSSFAINNTALSPYARVHVGTASTADTIAYQIVLCHEEENWQLTVFERLLSIIRDTSCNGRGSVINVTDRVTAGPGSTSICANPDNTAYTGSPDMSTSLTASFGQLSVVLSCEKLRQSQERGEAESKYNQLNCVAGNDDMILGGMKSNMRHVFCSPKSRSMTIGSRATKCAASVFHKTYAVSTDGSCPSLKHDMSLTAVGNKKVCMSTVEVDKKLCDCFEKNNVAKCNNMKCSYKCNAENCIYNNDTVLSSMSDHVNSFNSCQCDLSSIYTDQIHFPKETVPLSQINLFDLDFEAQNESAPSQQGNSFIENRFMSAQFEDIKSDGVCVNSEAFKNRKAVNVLHQPAACHLVTFPHSVNKPDMEDLELLMNSSPFQNESLCLMQSKTLGLVCESLPCNVFSEEKRDFETLQINLESIPSDVMADVVFCSKSNMNCDKNKMAETIDMPESEDLEAFLDVFCEDISTEDENDNETIGNFMNENSEKAERRSDVVKAINIVENNGVFHRNSVKKHLKLTPGDVNNCHTIRGTKSCLFQSIINVSQTKLNTTKKNSECSSNKIKHLYVDEESRPRPDVNAMFEDIESIFAESFSQDTPSISTSYAGSTTHQLNGSSDLFDVMSQMSCVNESMVPITENNCQNLITPEMDVGDLKSRRKSVQFSKFLRQESCVQLIDLRMTITSSPLETKMQSEVLRSCLRKKKKNTGVYRPHFLLGTNEHLQSINSPVVQIESEDLFTPSPIGKMTGPCQCTTPDLWSDDEMTASCSYNTSLTQSCSSSGKAVKSISNNSDSLFTQHFSYTAHSCVGNETCDKNAEGRYEQQMPVSSGCSYCPVASPVIRMSSQHCPVKVLLTPLELPYYSASSCKSPDLFEDSSLDATNSISICREELCKKLFM